MYLAIVILLLVLGPLVSIAVDWHSSAGAARLAFLFGKWFTFWAAGLRLALAGIRQILNPRYTAQEILGLKGSEPFIVIRELGFANVSIGAIGIGSLFFRSWLHPAALAGALFYGLVGVNHIFTRSRNAMENVAMTSDLYVSAILIWYCVSRWH